MFWTRFKSVLVFVPLMLGMIYLGGIPFQVFIAGILGIGAWEYWRVLITMGFRPNKIILVLGVLILATHRILFNFQFTDLVLVIIVFLIGLYNLIQYERGEEGALINFVLELSSILFIGWIGSYFISIRNLGPDNAGRWWLLTVLPATWMVDMGAYTIGKPWGKHKMLPRLSPNKSWEGFAGGIIFGAVSGALLSLLWHKFLPDFTPWQGMLLGLILAFITPVGDVLISMIKRIAKIKDTSTLIPGHGGILDRIDTWIWAAAFGYYLYGLFFPG